MLDTPVTPEIPVRPIDPLDALDKVSPWPPPPVQRRRRRGLGALLALVMGTSAAAGGAAGWLAATAGHDDIETSAATACTTAVATSLDSSRLADDGMDVAAVLASAEASIVEINTTVSYRQGPFQMQGEAAGTGMVLTADGLALTNAHVVADATSITVKLSDGTSYDATVVHADTTDDVAVIQLDGASGLTPATFGSSADVVVGDDVVVIGNALDLGDTMSVSRGIVSALDRTITTSEGTLTGLIQTDAAISSGDSGGAMLDASGRVIGMNSAGATDSSGVTVENIGFAIPIDAALSIVADWGISVG